VQEDAEQAVDLAEVAPLEQAPGQLVGAGIAERARG
jgi:hypothetical protein